MSECTVEECPRKILTVMVQENGIIRLTSGLFIARLDNDVSFESLKEG